MSTSGRKVLRFIVRGVLQSTRQGVFPVPMSAKRCAWHAYPYSLTTADIGKSFQFCRNNVSSRSTSCSGIFRVP